MSVRSVSIITGVVNEANNIKNWLDGVRENSSFSDDCTIKEVIIVDDGSNDGTDELIEDYTRQSLPFKLVLIRRESKNGILNSNVTASRAAIGDYVVIMDADLQHDPGFIPHFLKQINMGYDIVIGSRYMAGGSNDWEAFRGVVSRVARYLAQFLFPSISNVTDPLSGYFACRRQFVSLLIPYRNMTKTLLFVLIGSHSRRISEIPIKMRRRTAGRTKVLDNVPRTVMKFISELIVCHKMRGAKLPIKIAEEPKSFTARY